MRRRRVIFARRLAAVQADFRDWIGSPWKVTLLLGDTQLPDPGKAVSCPPSQRPSGVQWTDIAIVIVIKPKKKADLKETRLVSDTVMYQQAGQCRSNLLLPFLLSLIMAYSPDLIIFSFNDCWRAYLYTVVMNVIGLE